MWALALLTLLKVVLTCEQIKPQNGKSTAGSPQWDGCSFHVDVKLRTDINSHVLWLLTLCNSYFSWLTVRTWWIRWYTTKQNKTTSSSNNYQITWRNRTFHHIAYSFSWANIFGKSFSLQSGFFFFFIYIIHNYSDITCKRTGLRKLGHWVKDNLQPVLWPKRNISSTKILQERDG